MNVIIGCECSGIVRDAFSELGHNAWSCDLKQCERRGQHITGNILDHLDGCYRGHSLPPVPWDLLIVHPDCTYLTASAEWAYKDADYMRYPHVGYHMSLEPETLRGEERRHARRAAVDFVFRLRDSGIPKIVIENPTGHLSSAWRKPNQIIQPYQFGEDASKATALWLIGLPMLVPTKHIPPRMVDGKPRWANQTDGGQNRLSPSPTRAADRSRTYRGIAQAMAEQWSIA